MKSLNLLLMRINIVCIERFSAFMSYVCHIFTATNRRAHRSSLRADSQKLLLEIDLDQRLLAYEV